VPKYSPSQAEAQLSKLSGWRLSGNGDRIRKEWRVADFQAGIAFFGRVCDLAEAEQHHPDLHLTGYRNVVVELMTHAIGGLSENDFILAAKVDALPIDGKAKIG
jgi:4a-hydroxytetrahydrobiopterin dehydratase